MLTYKQFITKINESIVDDMSKTLVGLDADLITQYENLVKLISNPPEQQKTILDFSRLNREYLDKNLTESDNILKIRKVVYSIFKTIYAIETISIDKITSKEFTFETLYKGSTENTKKMFLMKPDDFNKNILPFVNEFIIFYAKQQKIDEIKLKEHLNKHTEPLNIEDANTTAEPIKQTEIQVQQANKGTSEGNIEINKDQLDKMKIEILRYFDKNIYKPLQESIKRVTPENSVNVQANAIASKTANTNNKEGVAKIIQNISQMSPAELNKLRDQIGLTSNEVGNF